MEALGGINVKVYYDEQNTHCIVKYYEINVEDSLKSNFSIYEPMIEHITLRKYNENDYNFVYEVKKNAYKKYVEEILEKLG